MAFFRRLFDYWRWILLILISHMLKMYSITRSYYFFVHRCNAYKASSTLESFVAYDQQLIFVGGSSIKSLFIFYYQTFEEVVLCFFDFDFIWFSPPLLLLPPWWCRSSFFLVFCWGALPWPLFYKHILLWKDNSTSHLLWYSVPPYFAILVNDDAHPILHPFISPLVGDFVPPSKFSPQLAITLGYQA